MTMAVEDLDFVQRLFPIKRRGLLKDISYTFFKVGYLFLMVVTGHKDVFSSCDLSRE